VHFGKPSLRKKRTLKEFDTSDLLVILQLADSCPAFHNRRSGIVEHVCNHDDAFGSVELGESGESYLRKGKKIRGEQRALISILDHGCCSRENQPLKGLIL
jgi:hypothetical protein